METPYNIATLVSMVFRVLRNSVEEEEYNLKLQSLYLTNGKR